VAHNTVVIDEADQAAATGALLRAVLLPDVGFARASAGEVYPGVASLTRQLAHTPDYAVDLFQVRALDGAEHQIDLLYHNHGHASADVALSPYAGFPAQAGYQHLREAAAAAVDGDLSVRFDLGGSEGQPYGGVWASSAEVSGDYTLSRQQAVSGAGSGRLGYDFSGGAGYLLYTTPTPAQSAAPLAVRLQLYGDASGAQLGLRLMDATDERFVHTVGALDWSGWRELRVADPATWGHYLGNDDGVIDLPVKSVVVELHALEGSPASGALFVDDLVLELQGAGELLIEDYERLDRALTWQVLGAPGTTLVVGEGLGPDLTVPVPFAMLRRTAQDTDFVSLLEPHGLARAIEGFAALPVDAAAEDEAHAFQVQAAAWVDHLLTVGQGAAGTSRQAGELRCDGTLCYLRQDEAGAMRAVAVADCRQLSHGGTDYLLAEGPLVGLRAELEATTLVVSGAPTTGRVELLAPGAAAVTDPEGAALAWEREGDLVVLNPAPSPDAGAADGSTPDVGAADSSTLDAGSVLPDAAIAADGAIGVDGAVGADGAARLDAAAVDAVGDDAPVADRASSPDQRDEEGAAAVGQGCDCAAQGARGGASVGALLLALLLVLRRCAAGRAQRSGSPASRPPAVPCSPGAASPALARSMTRVSAATRVAAWMGLVSTSTMPASRQR
jgi:hypothetical protein